MTPERVAVLRMYEELLPEKTAKNVETSVYNKAVHDAESLIDQASWDDPTFSHLYKSIHCYVYALLGDTKIIDRIKSKELISNRVAFYKSSEIYPDKWTPTVFEEGSEAEEGIFQCKQCGSRKTTYISVQTRSADEPMTNFITCTECKHRWKM